MPSGIQQPTRIQTPDSGFLGLDTASEPTSLSIARSRRLYNAYQGKLRAITKRPGSAPVITSALSNPIIHLTIDPFLNELLASSGTSLYKYAAGALTSVTMTNNIVSADIYDEDFTNSVLTKRKLIADTGKLKEYDGTAVKEVVPAADDPNPAPPNVLNDINAKGCKYIWVHNSHVFVSPGTNEMFYSKRYEYDYFPQTQYFLLVRDGDYINGPGVPFDSVCFVPMRRGWNIITGTNFDSFDAAEYLNTINGVIAPRSIVGKMTYPNGLQTVPYLSDDGVHEIFNTSPDNRGRYYSTRSITKDKLDWEAFGFTKVEMSLAIAKYIVEWNMYVLEISRAGTPYVFGYDTRNAEWYMWTGLTINSLIEFGGVVYFGGDDGLLKQFDAELYSDWANKDKTTGVPVDFDRISGMIWFEDTGYPSTLDYYILRLKQYAVKASLDISIVYLRSQVDVQEAIQNAYLIWDVSEWDESSWANLGYTDLVSSPQRLSTRLKLPKQAFYFQIRWRNNRDEPCEIYAETLVGRTSGEI